MSLWLNTQIMAEKWFAKQQKTAFKKSCLTKHFHQVLSNIMISFDRFGIIQRKSVYIVFQKNFSSLSLRHNLAVFHLAILQAEIQEKGLRRRYVQFNCILYSKSRCLFFLLVFNRCSFILKKFKLSYLAVSMYGGILIFVSRSNHCSGVLVQDSRAWLKIKASQVNQSKVYYYPCE